MSDKKEFMILKESVALSWINDCFTFGMLALLFYFNKAFLESAIPEWILGLLFVLGLMAKASNAKRTFFNAADAKEEIDRFYAGKKG